MLQNNILNNVIEFRFDVAGAGACLKRYTDPSFFKVETSAMTRSDVQREKKIRKAKVTPLRKTYFAFNNKATVQRPRILLTDSIF